MRACSIRVARARCGPRERSLACWPRLCLLLAVNTVLKCNARVLLLGRERGGRGASHGACTCARGTPDFAEAAFITCSRRVSAALQHLSGWWQRRAAALDVHCGRPLPPRQGTGWPRCELTAMCCSPPADNRARWGMRSCSPCSLPVLVVRRVAPMEGFLSNSEVLRVLQDRGAGAHTEPGARALPSERLVRRDRVAQLVLAVGAGRSTSAPLFLLFCRRTITCSTTRRA